MRNQQVEKIGRQVSTLYRQTQKFINRRMQPYGLKYSDHAFLIYIAKNPGLNQRRLARLLSIDEAVVTRVLKKLEENGFVRRERDPEDLRSFCLYLTARGEELIPALQETFNALDSVLTQGFDTASLITLRTQLEKMTDNACAANGEEL